MINDTKTFILILSIICWGVGLFLLWLASWKTMVGTALVLVATNLDRRLREWYGD